MSIRMFMSVQNPSAILNSFASSIKLKSCLVIEMSSSSSMSSFFKQTYEKIPKNGVINVYGPQGCGKTFFFSKLKHINFDHDLLRTKEKTNDFLQMMRCSLLPLVLDNFELVETLPGVKELKKIRVPFFITSQTKITHEVITSHFELPKVPFEEFAEKMGISNEKAEKLITDAKGNMTVVSTNLETFDCVRDVFIGSKDYVREIVEAESMTQFINRHLNEHGNTFGMIHENYPDFTNKFETVAHSLSDAQLIDDRIYSDISWNLVPFFNVSACLIPGQYMKLDNGKPLDKNTFLDIRPGSMWTKYSNMCMKMHRLKRLRMPIEHISVWAIKANSGEKIPFDSYDLDSINQLSFIKIKPKILTLLKKCLKAAEASR